MTGLVSVSYAPVVYVGDVTQLLLMIYAHVSAYAGQPSSNLYGKPHNIIYITLHGPCVMYRIILVGHDIHRVSLLCSGGQKCNDVGKKF